MTTPLEAETPWTLPTRLCRDCELTKPLEDFGWRTVRGTPYRESYCKLCKALRSKAWRQKRKDEQDGN